MFILKGANWDYPYFCVNKEYEIQNESRILCVVRYPIIEC